MIAAVLLAGICAELLYERYTHGAEPVSVETTQEYVPENVAYFYQKDDVWKLDKLGDSVYTMEDSGCLTCCVAAILQMQDISVDGLSVDADAGAVNQFFSEKGVYDGDGNLQWDVMEQVTDVSVVKQDASELDDGALDAYLTEGYYPIVRVRVGGDGSYHYVLIVCSRDGEYWCMDPLEETQTLVPLSDFGGEVYAVRVLQNKNNTVWYNDRSMVCHDNSGI